jgi:hypothetical protein
MVAMFITTAIFVMMTMVEAVAMVKYL